ncbi:anthranilate synthase component I [Butyrivibrio sp. CB08]|uniref:anthranilate synthase component I n=1 Tax=Butyrivibrio sp. CB08 TaxID=2364879 RepID=UPI000EA99911|nr:anthranilate synthase component I [Butyrivibrio sp. CB08]RKM62189.1 anthranilate synthase component I [Butyrivibrio sp. CB08]
MATTPFCEVKELAKTGKYRLIPIMKDILSDVATPVQVMRKLKNVSNHCFLLESVEDSRQWGRYSFLGYNPTMQLSGRGQEMTVTYDCGKEETFTIDNPSDYIRELVDKNRAPKLPDAPTFTGGLVGYFSYDYMQYAEPSLHFYAKNEHDFSDFDLMLFESLICFDNLKQKILLISNVKVPENTEGASFERDITDAYEVAISNIAKMEDLILNGQMMEIPKGKLKSEIQPLFPKEEYCRKVDKVKEHIVEGDIFQLVLSNPMEADFEGSLFDTYRILRTTNPSPYMFYFSGDTEIAGASPETLVKVEDGVIRTFPLAGTRPRGATLEEDLALEKELLADEKERAEHNMLVDLGRNDLGKLCEFGSVEVEKYMVVERYSHVMHIGSSVKGKLRDDRSAIDAIDAVLPAGTLSGAPKIRACQIIDELEGVKRGIYGGAIGYVDFTGNLDTCIAIRLAYKKNGKVFVRSGAGLVADSVPESEFTECVNKAKAVVNAIKEACDDSDN